MSLFKAPMGVIKKIDQCRRAFLWGGLNSKRKMARVNWSQVCSPKMVSGMGVVNLQIRNKTLLAKWW